MGSDPKTEAGPTMRETVGRYIVAMTRQSSGHTTDAEVQAAYEAMYDAMSEPARLVSPADREGLQAAATEAKDKIALFLWDGDTNNGGDDALVEEAHDILREALARLVQREDAPLDARIRGYREGRASVWEELVEYVNEARDNADRIVAETDGPLPTADDVRGILAREGQGA